MINFYVGNVLTDVRCDDPVDMEFISDLIKFKHPNAWFVPSHRTWVQSKGDRGWDGYIRFLKRGSLPTGLLKFVVEKLSEKQYEFEIADERKKPSLNGNGRLFGLNVKIEPHQVDCLDILRNKMSGIPWCRGVFDHCTSSGKTLSAAMLIKRINQSTIYIVPTKDLLMQTSDVLGKALDQEVGKIGDTWFDLDKKVTVSTAAMLMKRFLPKTRPQEVTNFINRQKVLVADETHHIKDNKWFDVVKLFPAYYRFGFSGSPFDGGRSLGDISLLAATGDIFSIVKTRELIDKDKLLSDLQILLFEVSDPNLLGFPYEQAYESGIASNYSRNRLIAKIASAAADADKTILILIQRLRQGRQLKEILERECGRKAIFLKGADSSADRKLVVKNIKKYRIVIASGIWDEGVDAPDINFLILAGGGKSRKKVLQRVGRGLRKKKSGLNMLLVADFIDKTNRYLLEHSNERIAVYRREQWGAKAASMQDLMQVLAEHKKIEKKIRLTT